MNVFELDSRTVSAHTDALRHDAAALHPLAQPPLELSGPAAQFGAAVTAAIEAANRSAADLVAETYRLASAMDLAAHAADSVDGATSHCLGAML